VDRDLTPQEISKRRRRRLVRAAAIALGAVALVLAAARALEPSVERAGLRTAVVERGELAATVPAQARIVPADEVQLTAPVEARVVRVLKRPGDEVRAGEAILELDLAAARSELARLADRVAQERHRRRELELDGARALAELERRLAEARLDLESAEVVLGQRSTLAREGLISAGDRLAADVARRKAELVVAELASSLAAARVARGERLAGGALDLAIVAKERDELERKLERATTRADRDGIVTWVLADEGATVRPGDLVARVADLDSFRLEATASEIHAPRLAPGLEVRFEPAPGEELRGRIVRVDPTIDAAAVRFTALLDRPDHPALRNHLRLDADVVLDLRAGVLKVRRPVFSSPGARQNVFVVERGRLRRRAATFGLAGRDEIEIVAGLEAGDEIVISDPSSFAHLEELALR
jgi:HlyD family secretion protein